jgi:hypothetical protein
VGQLSKTTRSGLIEWSTGSAEFGPRWYPTGEVKIAVRCRIENFKPQYSAFLDTGASIPVIGGEMSVRLQNRPIEKEKVRMDTRLGEIRGSIVRMTITLVADHGKDLPIEGSILLARKWNGPSIVLGYEGFLNRLRFAFDPGLQAPGERIFYFGNGVDPAV